MSTAVQVATDCAQQAALSGWPLAIAVIGVAIAFALMIKWM